jgi:myxalamid-type polyketide synthase MxaC
MELEQNSEVSQLKRALLALKEMRSKLEALEQARTEPLAVIGMGCRFPGGANSPEAFWNLLKSGVDAITDVPPDRWPAEEIYASDFMEPGKANTRWGGFLKDVDQFDPGFFGISPREAMHMDPQQRILIQVAYEALENAGQSLDHLEGSLTGVFAGIHSHSSDYAWMQMRDLNDIDTHTGVGTAHSIIANRLSYVFNWQGPSLVVDTACSSSLVAAHLACQSLRNRECNLALVAGVNLFLRPESTITFSKLQMMATDGRCKTFDSRADGFVRGEGCGVIVLKRLSEAVADGDRILALIQSSAVNQDGRTNGLTAPNGLSQQNVIRQALANGRVSAEQITYVETHGTGTKLGDPIEVEALAEVIGKRTPDSRPCILGSVKANIGHLEAAAGIAGLIKTILVLQNELIPHQLHVKQLNPLIELENSRFEIPTAKRKYPRQENFPRFAGVSSFGFGGTNAHIILSETPLDQVVEIPSSPAPHILALSARSDESLRELVNAYQAYLSSTESSLNDILFTANRHRTHHDKRLTIVGSTSADLIEKIHVFQRKEEHPDIAHGQVVPSGERGLVFVFSGQGPQWANMGCELLQTEPVFHQKILEIDECLNQLVSWSLVDELLAPEENSRLSETEVAQPAIFAIQLALTALWKSWGINPEAVVGHSVGEIAAAHVAGVLSLEDAVRVVYHRSRLMQRLTGQGKMAALGVTREKAEVIASQYDGLSVGAVNSPVSNVLSGNAEALEEIVAALTKDKIFARMLPVNYAFHSPVMDSLTAELTDALKGISPRPAAIALYSTVRGERAKEGDYGAAYWAKNIRQPVLFEPAIRALTGRGYNTFLEVSPHPVLSESISQTLGSKTNGLIVPSLRRNQPERSVMLRSLGTLFTRGFPVKWEALYPMGRIVDLPPYPWQNQRYWLPNSKYVRFSRVESPSVSSNENMDWFYDLVWMKLPEIEQTLASQAHGEWLILADQNELGAALAEKLMKYGIGSRVAVNGNTLDQGVWLQTSKTPLGIIDLRALKPKEPTDDSFCVSILSSVKALVNYTGNSSPKLWIVTQGVQQVKKEIISANAASQSLLWGLGRTLSLEHPEVWGGLIDLDYRQTSDLAEAIARELTMAQGEDQVAIRAEKRYGLRLERVNQPAPSPINIAGDGAYLITGGLGALGQEIARWLVKRGAKHLVLTSRTGVSDHTRSFVEELETAGATVSVLKADVADEARMTAVFEEFGRSLPQLRGVIHAAGVTSTKSLDSMDEHSLREVLKAKVAGSWLLHRLTQNLNPDFFVLFSSSSAILGSAGLGHYAAANHFLDTLAHIRRGLNLPALSINWGWWSGAGIATADLEQQFRQIGQKAMPAEEALQALECYVCSETTQVLIASIDWSKFKPVYEAKRKRPLIEQIEVREEGQQKSGPLFAEHLFSVPASQRMEILQSHVRDQVAHVLGFSPADRIDPQQGFFSIGMDSVMAVQLRIRLETSLGQTLPSTLAFEYPTIELMSEYLAGEVLKLNGNVSTRSNEDTIHIGTSQMLSEEELLSKLDDELAAFNKLVDGE